MKAINNDIRQLLDSSIHSYKFTKIHLSDNTLTVEIEVREHNKLERYEATGNSVQEVATKLIDKHLNSTMQKATSIADKMLSLLI